ncbi:MAG: 3-dehydroquinate dehydratase [Muribaculaceae bacterium]|nr:3-dehydroquinate dehydratase [Muribaculaceae bacterium]
MIAIINGPNLNLLGKREPEIYGAEPFETTLLSITEEFKGEQIEYLQSNTEGEIIDALHQFGYNSNCKGIVLNPGAYAHYSIAIADAISAIPVPVVEVHISNIHAREEFRQKSVTARAATAIIAGFGRRGYNMAADYLINSK